MQQDIATTRSIEGGDGHALTIGLDVGDRYTHVSSSAAAAKRERRVRTTAPALGGALEDLPRARVVLEAGPRSPWLSRLVAGLGHEVVVANPRQVALIARNQRKTDRLALVVSGAAAPNERGRGEARASEKAAPQQRAPIEPALSPLRLHPHSTPCHSARNAIAERVTVRSHERASAAGRGRNLRGSPYRRPSVRQLSGNAVHAVRKRAPARRRTLGSRCATLTCSVGWPGPRRSRRRDRHTRAGSRWAPAGSGARAPASSPRDRRRRAEAAYKGCLARR